MIGVEAAYGFGDGVFLVPLIKRIAEHHSEPIEVAVQEQCADAFYNLQWVSNIVHIRNLNDGISRFLRYKHKYQITPNIHFPTFCVMDPQHSLIDTALLIGRLYKLGDIDQRPIFIPTTKESDIDLGIKRPMIAIESHHKSGQSWANKNSFNQVIDKYKNTHEILWLSNQDCPQGANPLSGLTRRQIIPLLEKCERFFSVGSGFFCASLALQNPPPTVCLWIDHYYRYERRLAELGWNKNIAWVHNLEELKGVL